MAFELIGTKLIR